MTHDDAIRRRFGENADAVIAHARGQVTHLREQLRDWLAPLRGDERALDVGCGAGPLALALAPLVGEVVGVDLVPELLDAARADAPANATFVRGDATALPFEDESFDLACSRRTLHHAARPEDVVAEMARVVKSGGRVLIDDQIAPDDPLAAFELDRFERARDPAHHRTLPDAELRELFAANGLSVERSETFTHDRELNHYLFLAGCTGEDAERVKRLSPGGPEHYVAGSVRYLCRR